MAYAACMREHGVEMADPTFDADGVRTLSYGTGSVNNVKSIVLDDGRILVAATLEEGAPGRYGVWRLLPDGSLDTTFGTGGFAELDWPTIAWVDRPDGSFSRYGLTAYRADPAGNLAVQVTYTGYDAQPDVYWDGTGWARVLLAP